MLPVSTCELLLIQRYHLLCTLSRRSVDLRYTYLVKIIALITLSTYNLEKVCDIHVTSDNVFYSIGIPSARLFTHFDILSEFPVLCAHKDCNDREC